MEDERAGSSSESEEHQSPRKARKTWLENKLKEVEQEMDAVNHGKHPELTRKCSLLEDVKKQRLRIAERYQEQRRKNIEQQYEAEKKQVLDQHEADLSYMRNTIIDNLNDLRKKLEHELHKTPHDHVDHRIPTRRTRRRRVPTAVPGGFSGSLGAVGAVGGLDAASDNTPAYNLDYTTQSIDIGSRKKAVAPPGLKKALNINLTLKAEEIQNDLKLIQTSKRPGSMAMLEDDRHLKAPKI